MNAPSKIGIFSLLGAILLHLFLFGFFIYYDHAFSSLTNKSTNLHQIYPIHLYYCLPEKVNACHKQKSLENKHLLLMPEYIQSSHASAILKHSLSPSSENENYKSDHQLNNLIVLLHSAIQLHQQYPREAQLMHEEGTSTVGFNLRLDGEITNVHIIESSGNKSIDLASLNAVKNASPIELNPESISFLKKHSQLFELKIAFNLD